MTKLTDELLVAYLDGELSVEQLVFVEAELRRDPDAAARLGAFRTISSLVRVVGPGSQIRLRQDQTVSSGKRPGRPRLLAKVGVASACAAGLLWAGSSLFDQAVDPSRHRLLHAAAERFSLYAEKLPGMVLMPGVLEEQATEWLSRQLGAPTSIPHLPGWTLTASQVLQEGSAPAVELFFTAPGRSPIAMCITPSGGDDRPPKMGAIRDLRVTEWDQHGFFLALLGPLDEGELIRLTNQVRDTWPGHHGPTGVTPGGGSPGTVQKHAAASAVPPDVTGAP